MTGILKIERIGMEADIPSIKTKSVFEDFDDVMFIRSRTRDK